MCGHYNASQNWGLNTQNEISRVLHNHRDVLVLEMDGSLTPLAICDPSMRMQSIEPNHDAEMSCGRCGAMKKEKMQIRRSVRFPQSRLLQGKHMHTNVMKLLQNHSLPGGARNGTVSR